MSGRDDRRGRRRLALRRETVRALSDLDLTRVAGGTYTESCDCWTDGCDTSECWYTKGSLYC